MRAPAKPFGWAELAAFIGPLTVPYPGWNGGRIDVDIVGHAPTCSEFFAVSTRTVCRWRAEGLTVDQADRCAVALGVHPSAIWPSWFEAAA